MALPNRKSTTADQSTSIGLKTVDTNINMASTTKLDDSNMVDIEGKRVEASCTNNTKPDNPDEIFHANSD